MQYTTMQALCIHLPMLLCIHYGSIIIEAHYKICFTVTIIVQIFALKASTSVIQRGLVLTLIWHVMGFLTVWEMYKE